MLHRSARVEGDIMHQGIGMEMGTHYEGRLFWDRERGGDPHGPRTERLQNKERAAAD